VDLAGHRDAVARPRVLRKTEADGGVLAGPGTGKRTTVLRLVARLAEEEPGAKVKVITSAMVGQLGIGPCPGRRHRAAARRRPYLPAR
jgi:hypothetical protein